MMMIYGMFVFSLSTAAYQDLQRQTNWRHASQSRINARPSRQYLGPDDDKITLGGTLLPQFTGGQQNIDHLRALADDGKAWPLIEGSGYYYGMHVIESINESKSAFFRDGAAAQIDFSLTLARIDDARAELIGVATSSTLRALTGALA